MDPGGAGGVAAPFPCLPTGISKFFGFCAGSNVHMGMFRHVRRLEVLRLMQQAGGISQNPHHLRMNGQARTRSQHTCEADSRFAIIQDFQQP